MLTAEQKYDLWVWMPSGQISQADVSGVRSSLGEGVWEGCGDRSRQGPVVVVDGRPVDYAAQHGVLVAEDDELEVFGVAGTDREAGQGSQESVDDAKHETQGWRDRPWSAPTRHFPGTTSTHDPISGTHNSRMARVRFGIAQLGFVCQPPPAS
jgi:hypothetical protein